MGLDPYENMAIDEALLQNYIYTQRPVFRIYTWRPSAFSVGFSQKIRKALNIEHCRRNSIDFVRRLTGGTIIFHSQEITYSLVCSQSDIGESVNVKESFKILCSFLFYFYRRLRLEPVFAADLPEHKRGRSSFCFAACEDYDIVIGNKKIGGNAQRRKRDIIFQHGSIPLSLDFSGFSKFLNDDFPNLSRDTAGLSPLLPEKKYAQNDLIELLKKSFKSAFGCEFDRAGISQKEKQMASELKVNKYRTERWNLRR